MTSYIGWWGMRTRKAKWHLVESEVTDRLVMRCGRMMRFTAYQETMTFDEKPRWGDRCEQCTRPKVGG